jgi:hypothetical protein
VSVSPSPAFAGSPVTVRFGVPVGAAGYPVNDLDLAIFDVQGRRVVTLARGQLVAPGGAASVTWDGRTEAGSPAAPGVYFARLASPSEGISRERKFVVVR